MDYSYIRRAGVSVNLPNGVWKILLQSQGPACNWDAPGSQSELAGVCFGGQKEDTGRRATSRLHESQTAAGASGRCRCLSLSLLILCQQSSLAERSPNFPKAKLIRRAETVDPSFLAGLVCSDTGRIGTNDGAGRLMRTVSGNKAVAKSSCER